MTRHLDLRGGKPVWVTYKAPEVPVHELTRDAKCDVLIVGMGISGAMMAESLTDAGFSVIVIDRRDGAMLGSTPATTALVQFEIDQPLSTLSKKLGTAKAEQAWRRSRNAVANLQARIEDLGIPCDHEPRNSLFIVGDVMDADALKAEADMRRAAGIYSRFLNASELSHEFGLEREGAILSFDNLAINPRKLTAHLHLKAIERGARYFAPVEAVEVKDSCDGVEVTTDSGHTISADHLVLATGYELLDPAPQSGHKIISTWAIATEPQPENLWPKETFIWEASDPYLYLRTLPDGRVICGGEDEDFTDEDKRDAMLQEKTERISAKMKALMPKLDTKPAFRWSGSFGVTETGLPWIGALPSHPRIFSMMGYGGNGITYSRIGVELVTGALTGNPDSDADLFAFTSGVSLIRRLIPTALA
ncbi:NAD(P)/FAD-dependent oxidoreductase [Tianweitania populi]|uniref:FAD-dependent oxidoreductase n=1 Tax=Tianweitania populi TaxID=1607949 RepID=A0A8J3GKD7_9HYPH|nr:FAD-dependent oxidoreductase [Tianweitania populi]GHD11485.1 FAD-dependent oxidoreductase [Tianweitania populi]